MPTRIISEYRREVESISDEKDLRVLIYVLLSKMGFSNVEITHGANEEGKDLVATKPNGLGGLDWYAFVVKIGGIKGSTNPKDTMVLNVRAQVQLCFEQPFFYAKENREVYMNKVVVAANGAISANAKHQLTNTVKEKANLTYWHLSSIAELVSQHVPDYFADIDLFVSEYYHTLDQDFEKLNELRSFRYRKELKRLIDIFIEPTLVIEKTRSQPPNQLPGDTPKYQFRKGNTLLESNENVLIVGEPGSGKSMLFRELILETIKRCKASKDYKKMPVLARFKDVADKGSVVEAIRAAIQVHNPHNYEYSIETKLEKGEICLYLDALDEVSDDAARQKALDEVAAFSRAYPRVRTLASSRKIDFLEQREQVGNFVKMKMMPLAYRQMQLLISKWFSKNEAKKKLLLESLRDTEIMNKLPKTPLVVTLIAIIFDETEREIPANLAELYSMFTEVFLGRWDIEKGVEAKFEYVFKDRLLGKLALLLHENHTDEIVEDALLQFAQAYFDERGLEIDAREFIEEIVHRSQLLFKNTRGSYQFKHLSFQEYFASKQLFEEQANKSFIVEKFLDIWWQEVIFFYCGRMKECPQEIRDIIEKVPFDTMAAQFRKVTGLGHILQAAYATTVPLKTDAVMHALEILIRSYEKIQSEDIGGLKSFRRSSRFILLHFFSYLFDLYYGSITLKKPLLNCFEANKVNLQAATAEKKSELAMKLFFVALAMEEQGDASLMLEMSKIADSADLSLAYAVQLRLEAAKEKEGKRDSTLQDALRTIKRRTTKWRHELIKELKTPAGNKLLGSSTDSTV